MQKLITAGAALLLVAIGAFSTAHSDAQRATRTTQGEIIEKDGKVGTLEKLIGPKEVTYTTAFPVQFMPHGQPGTWEIVTHEDVVLLLNTASGETFHLEEDGDRLFWKPIHRPGMERHDMPRMPEMPRMPRERADREDLNPERLAERIEELRKKIKEARGESLEKLERAIEELERTRERRGEPEKNGERKGDANRHAEELEEVIHEIEEKIDGLKERWEESDSVREREKIDKAVKELKEEADRVRKELKELRR